MFSKSEKTSSPVCNARCAVAARTAAALRSFDFFFFFRFERRCGP